MERKFTDARKVIKKNGQETYILIQRLETLEQSSQMLKDENDKLKSNMAVSKGETITTFNQRARFIFILKLSQVFHFALCPRQ